MAYDDPVDWDWDDDKDDGTWTAPVSGWYKIFSGSVPQLACTHEHCCYPELECTESATPDGDLEATGGSVTE